MVDRSGFLVVGGDSLVGSGVISALRRRGHDFLSTTRRRETLSQERIFLDFEDPEGFVAPSHIGYAFVIAAATNYDRCETDPMARVINVDLVPRTVASLLQQGVHVTYISTNSVFGGNRAWPGEDDPHDAQIAYAQQKSDSETVVWAHADRLGARGLLNIVRLTKILDTGVSPLPSWFATWGRSETVTPFADLVFAPISVRFVGESLATIGEKRPTGSLHLSGAENVDYVTFARAVAARFGVQPELISPTTAVEKGVHIAFKPKYSGIGMKRTTALTGIEPMPLAELIEDLVADRATVERNAG
jgi:dTDP-4-dehydrorhamnose reductase